MRKSQTFYWLISGNLHIDCIWICVMIIWESKRQIIFISIIYRFHTILHKSSRMGFEYNLFFFLICIRIK